MNILVTGGLGFIGSNFIKYIINKKQVDVVINIDTITKTS
jgi:dTDP-D-glucose 4,6-dehydratase